MKLFNLLAGSAVLVLFIGVTQAQTDYTTMTLNFENITSSNVEQNVPESTTGGGGSGHEKEIDFGDWDDDGDMDAVMAVARSDFGERRNKLYRNDNGIMIEVSGPAQDGNPQVIPGFDSQDVGRSAFLRDCDHDGWLDIIVVCDANSGTGSPESAGKTKYYRNVGGTSFVNESARLSNQSGSACNGTAEDFDGNGYCDLYMCNYPGQSQDSLGLNNFMGAGAGQFTLVTNTHVPMESNYGVHSEAADMNGDGKIDLLVANETCDPAYIYYNNKNGAGSGDGDFRYSGSEQQIPENQGGCWENAMIPADFNNDGLMDFYFTNTGFYGNLSDSIHMNTGTNMMTGVAGFTHMPVSSLMTGESYKVNCNDLDGDGRVDLVVMSEDRRPYIFRNTSANGGISFLEWTPSIFTTTHEGWQCNSTNLVGDDPDRPEIFIGAMNNDFLFQNLDSEITDAAELIMGVLPTFHNAAPIAVSGCIDGGDTATFVATGIPEDARVSVLVRSSGDLSLTVDQSGSELGSSNRKGQHVDEAVQVTVPSSGSLVIDITNLSEGIMLGDINGDGFVNLLDVDPFILQLAFLTYSKAADMNQDGVVNLLDVDGFVEAIGNGGAGTVGNDYVIEFLSRTN